ncbi:MAG: hypothetical protein KIB40_22480 [Pantoea sp.]|uniref:hypothetical protein n=1 Tax=Pantoea TaxID=53335 RepID=UPI00132FB80A|nr:MULTISPECIES: hypothetical protein [Pantoea]MBS6035860.1 hypothetical protein [Pantoea sp.]MDH2124196.1 hypothetical protein [Pantoea brenneri]
MSVETQNIMRSVARKCRSEIISAIDGRPKSEHDSIITRLLDKHARTIKSLPPDAFPAKLWLAFYVRQVDKELRQ